MATERGERERGEREREREGERQAEAAIFCGNFSQINVSKHFFYRLKFAWSKFIFISLIFTYKRTDS